MASLVLVCANTVCELRKFSGIDSVGYDYIRLGNCHAQCARLLHEFNNDFSVQLAWVCQYSGWFG